MNCKLDLNIHKVKDNHQAILKIMFCLRHVNIVEELHLTVTMDTYCFALSWLKFWETMDFDFDHKIFTFFLRFTTLARLWF